MINKQQIQNNLNQINKLYQKNMGNRKALFYSKLAILEVCGWVEESMDDIIQINANRHLKEKQNLDYVDKPIIQLTYGFDYQNNFRNMLIQLIGIINVERLESNINSNKFLDMKSALGSLKKCRDRQAHTHIRGTTTVIDSPSVTQNRFHQVYEGLKDIELCVRKMKL